MSTADQIARARTAVARRAWTDAFDAFRGAFASMLAPAPAEVASTRASWGRDARFVVDRIAERAEAIGPARGRAPARKLP